MVIVLVKIAKAIGKNDVYVYLVVSVRTHL